MEKANERRRRKKKLNEFGAASSKGIESYKIGRGYWFSLVCAIHLPWVFFQLLGHVGN